MPEADLERTSTFVESYEVGHICEYCDQVFDVLSLAEQHEEACSRNTAKCGLHTEVTVSPLANYVMGDVVEAPNYLENEHENGRRGDNKDSSGSTPSVPTGSGTGSGSKSTSGPGDGTNMENKQTYDLKLWQRKDANPGFTVLPGNLRIRLEMLSTEGGQRRMHEKHQNEDKCC